MRTIRYEDIEKGSRPDLDFWPFIPTNPSAWEALRDVAPKGGSYVGHDGDDLYFQESDHYILVPVPEGF